jgi:hypothetical protein
MRSLIAIFVAGVLISTTVPSNAAPTSATRKLVTATTHYVVDGYGRWIGVGVMGSTVPPIAAANARSTYCNVKHIDDNTPCPSWTWWWRWRASPSPSP